MLNRSYTAILAATLLCVACAGSPSPSDPVGDASLGLAFEQIDRMVQASMEPHGTPGVALALTDRKALLGVRTYGLADVKLGAPVTEETLFQIGSITKSFTALALMQLADAGRFDPDRPVTDYLPWWQVQNTYGPVTGHHLLTHTAGIPSNRDNITGSPYMARAVRDQAVAWPPGTRMAYSNVGYQTLHVLLEELAGTPYVELIERRIFEPLGMRHSNASITLESRPAQAAGYVPAFDDRPAHRSRPLVEAPLLPYAIGDGSIQSTAADMAAYVRMLLNDGPGPEGRIVSEEAFERFATSHAPEGPERSNVGYGYGIGVRIDDDGRTLMHGGGMVGFVSRITADQASGLGVVVLMNGPGEPWRIAGYALRAARAALAGEPLPDLPQYEDPLRVETAEDYSGVYDTASGATLEFEPRGGGLVVRVEAESTALELRGEDTFYTPHPGLDRYVLRFGRNDAGELIEVAYGPHLYTNERYTGPDTFDNPEEWSAYVGRYRNYSPWSPYFEVFTRGGRLLLVTGEGGEASSDELELTAFDEGAFRVGEEPTPEVLRFDEVVDGRALRAVWSGHPFYRIAE